MRPISGGFCINWFGIGPLHHILSRSDFGYECAEMFITKERLADSASWEIADSASWEIADSASWEIAGSPTWRVGESPIL
jgi:hypothetical protein